MREKKMFAQRTRTRNTDEAKRKYFLVYEGKETEEIYFESVSQNRSKIGIDSLLELVPVVRSYSEEGWSNPKKIVDRMLLNLEESRLGVVSYETLLNWFMDYLYEEEILTNSKVKAKSLWQTLEWICKEKLHVMLTEQVENLEQTCRVIAEYFQDKEGYEQIIDDVPRIIQNRSITYAEGFDRICFVVDRDRESFVAHPENNQYEYVLNKCREKKFGFYLTNPCFEFWLLLHFDDVKELNKQQLLDNPKITAKRRYTEQELRKRVNGYTKSSYDADWFINRIDVAIQNEKLYCEDAEELEHFVGSRVGMLIEEMRRNAQQDFARK